MYLFIYFLDFYTVFLSLKATPELVPELCASVLRIPDWTFIHLTNKIQSLDLNDPTSLGFLTCLEICYNRENCCPSGGFVVLSWFSQRLDKSLDSNSSF